MKKTILFIGLILPVSIFSKQYTPGDILLVDKTRGGEVSWGQSENNNGTCYPSYNLSCPLNLCSP